MKLRSLQTLFGIVAMVGLLVGVPAVSADSCGSHKGEKTASSEKSGCTYQAKSNKSCGSTAMASSCGNTVVDVAKAAGSFNTLATALKAAGMVDALKAEGPFTVFAPTDDAFAKLPKGTVEALLKDLPKLRAVLKYHVVSGKLMAADVVKQDSAKTLLGQSAHISTKHGVMIENAKVIKTDIRASNGVIHVIDSVILPDADIVDIARKAGSFKTLMTAVHKAGLADALRGPGPLTVFAPTDEAFAKLPKGTVEALLKDLPKLRAILKYHVVAGELAATDVIKRDSIKTLLGQSAEIRHSSPVTIDGALITKTDIKAANGIIHVIDEVILPDPDIVDVAREAGSFKTLLTAVEAAGLADALRGEGPLTVFAPTDEAFAKLPKGTLDALLKNKDKLKAVLLYHVVPGAVKAADVVKLEHAKTLQGQSVRIDACDGVKINGASVIKADVHAANGVIHVIDQVIVPE